MLRKFALVVLLLLMLGQLTVCVCVCFFDAEKSAFIILSMVNRHFNELWDNHSIMRMFYQRYWCHFSCFCFFNVNF